jgi:SET domain-containing protein
MPSSTNVVVRPSSIQGVGIFAAQSFSAGEIILRRDESREVTADRPLRADLGEERRRCDDLAGGRVVLLGYPERHLNHCCDPNAYVRFIDGTGHICARRDIEAGEEITNDYCINSFGEGV